MNEQLLENLDRLADLIFDCGCIVCQQRHERLMRDLEIKYGCATEYMLQRKVEAN